MHKGLRQGRETATSIESDHAGSLYQRGLVALRNRQPETAIVLIGRAIALSEAEPRAEHHTALAAAHRRLGQMEPAAQHYRRALALEPDSADACVNLGAILRDLGDVEGALALYDRALDLKPDYAEAHYNRGLALRFRDRLEEAIACHRRAISLKPDFAPAHGALGVVLRDQGRLKDAEASLREALRLDPGNVGACNGLAIVLQAKGDLDGAIEACRRALAIHPSHAEAIYNLGLILNDQGRVAEAIAAFERALALRPRMAQARFALCMAQLPALCRDEAQIETRRTAYAYQLQSLADDARDDAVARDLAEGVGAGQPFYLAYQGRDDRDLQDLYGRTICRMMAARYPAAPLAAPPQPGEPIRIGIVSGYFRRHANWRIPIEGWLTRLDRGRFSLFGYHTGALQDDQTALAASLCERFVQGPLSTEGWRDAIAADAPHVLIYPEVGMDPMAVRLAAQRLAPVQCASWGHPSTSGLPTLDYYLSSEAMEPPGAEQHYTERLVRLPALSVYLQPPEPCEDDVSRAVLGLREGAAVYWCGQSLYKYRPAHDAVFARIAEAAGDCQFVFLEFPQGPILTALFRDRLREAFAQRGLDADRFCILLPRLTPERFNAAMGQCDIVLDSIGWSGCNSLLESLRYNLPVVSMAGPLMRGRHGAAILARAGVSDTISETIDGYVASAVRLARDREWRAAVAERLRRGKHHLYRDDGCITALEDFLQQVWSAL
jgi:protein O-GlcNAc transferase